MHTHKHIPTHTHPLRITQLRGTGRQGGPNQKQRKVRAVSAVLSSLPIVRQVMFSGISKDCPWRLHWCVQCAHPSLSRSHPRCPSPSHLLPPLTCTLPRAAHRPLESSSTPESFPILLFPLWPSPPVIPVVSACSSNPTNPKPATSLIPTARSSRSGSTTSLLEADLPALLPWSTLPLLQSHLVKALIRLYQPPLYTLQEATHWSRDKTCTSCPHPPPGVSHLPRIFQHVAASRMRRVEVKNSGSRRALPPPLPLCDLAQVS